MLLARQLVAPLFVYLRNLKALKKLKEVEHGSNLLGVQLSNGLCRSFAEVVIFLG